MRAQTHIAGALTAYGGLAVLADLPLTLPLAVLTAGCALLPDLDTQASTIGRLWPACARRIERRYGHRTLTHAYLGQALFALLVIPLLLIGPAPYIAAVVGYVSHAVLDTCTVEGVRLFWPWSDRRCVFPYYDGRPTAYRTRTGSRADRVLGVLFLVAFVPVVVVKATSYERVIRVLQADASSAVRDYLTMSATHRVWVDLVAEDPATGRRLEGQFEAIGSTDYHTLLVADTTGTVFSVGKPYDANFRAVAAVCHRGAPLTVTSRQVDLSGRLLADLDHHLPRLPDGALVRHRLSGSLRVDTPVQEATDSHRFNTVTATGTTVTLRYATRAHLAQLGLLSTLVVHGSLTVRLLLEPGLTETYAPGHRAPLQRVAYPYLRTQSLVVAVAVDDHVQQDDTLAVIDPSAVALAEQQYEAARLAEHAARADTVAGRLQQQVQRTLDRQVAAQAALTAVQQRHVAGYASDAEREAKHREALAAQQAHGSSVALLRQHDQARRQHLRTLALRTAKAQLARDAARRDAYLLAPAAGTIRQVDPAVPVGDRLELRVLIGPATAAAAPLPVFPPVPNTNPSLP
ncbi:MAG: hypothetical protein RhofKO_31940 [Rhodothermales bacterium]